MLKMTQVICFTFSEEERSSGRALHKEIELTCASKLWDFNTLFGSITLHVLGYGDSTMIVKQRRSVDEIITASNFKPTCAWRNRIKEKEFTLIPAANCILTWIRSASQAESDVP